MDKTPHIGIVGSRSWANRKYVENFTKYLIEQTGFILVSGGCKDSPDKYAEVAFKMFSKPPPLIHPARWRVDGVYNNRAGFERNTLIARDSDYLICFYDTESKTSGCLDTVKKMVSDKFWLIITPDFSYVVNPGFKEPDEVSEAILEYLK